MSARVAGRLILRPCKIAIAITTLIVAVSAYAQTSNPVGADPLDPKKLKLASVHAAVADLQSGDLLFIKDAQRQVPVASISKLLTAIVVLDSEAPMEEWLTISERKQQPPIESFTRLKLGSQLQRKDLLRIMLMSSENLAAYELAQNYAGGYSAFITAMNAKAKALDMLQSQWVNPSGLSEQNRASAADIVKLITAAAGYAKIREYTQTTFYSARFRKPSYSLPYGNTNPLVHRSDWDIRLSKTGYLDAAGQCLALVVNVEGREIVMAFLDSLGRRSPLGDTGRTTRWLKTGSGGSVARAARRYEHRKTRSYQVADNLAGTYISLDAPDRELQKQNRQSQPLRWLIPLTAPPRRAFLSLQ